MKLLPPHAQEDRRRARAARFSRRVRCALLSITACAFLACHAKAPVAPQPVVSLPAPESSSVPQTGVAVVVHKGDRRLSVLHDGVTVYEFPVVMGPATRGPKRFEGDMRTPEGLYRVIEKHPHPRWRYFIALSYPNDEDVAAYAAALQAGDVPLVNGEFAGIGGAVGIHGSDHTEDQDEGRDWTRGCVAMRSDDVARVYELVDRGTPVLILP